MPLHHHIYFNLQSNEYIQPFQSIAFETYEIMNGTERFQAVLSDLAHRLNSGEAFIPSSTFQADLTIIKSPKKGGKGKFTMGKQAISDVTRQKRSVIEIKKISIPFAVHVLFVLRKPGFTKMTVKTLSDIIIPHRCYYDKCLICKKEVHVLDHQCLIKCVDPKKDEKKKKSKKQLDYHRKINPDASVYMDPPVFAYADFEAMLALTRHICLFSCVLPLLSLILFILSMGRSVLNSS